MNMETKLSSKTPPEYGTVWYYANLFSDILADVGDDEKIDRIPLILAGLQLAIKQWHEYHQVAANKYADFLEKVKDINPD